MLEVRFGHIVYLGRLLVYLVLKNVNRLRHRALLQYIVEGECTVAACVPCIIASREYRSVTKKTHHQRFIGILEVTVAWHELNGTAPTYASDHFPN